MKIIIFGFTGAGKTTYLQNLKNSQGLDEYEYFDLDSYILTMANQYESIAEIISSKGWSHFRELEFESIKELLNKSNVVLSLGGGSVSESLIEYLKNVTDLKSIFLNVDFITCWNRIKNDVNRPITLDGIANCEVLYNKRIILYKKLESICSKY